MIRNYLKIAWRNLLNVKSYGMINLLGLTAGTICSLAILLYVQHQFGYEKQFTDSENIYKVATLNINSGDGESANMITSGPPIGPTIAKDYDEVITQARILNLDGEFLFSAEGSDKTFFQSGGYLVDSTFFQIFDIPLVQGDMKTALDNPHSLILSDETAAKLFGEGVSVLGKLVQVSGSNDDVTLTVKGVYHADIGKTHLNPDFLMSMGSTGMGSYVLGSDEWSGNNFAHTYIKLQPQAKPDLLASKFPKMLETYGGEQLRLAQKKKVISLVPIADIHLKTSEYEFGLHKNSSITYIYILLAIGLFIQLMACVNYINLTTAQATKRVKEIGVRKVNGAASKYLMYQFLTESIVVSTLAVLLAIPVIMLLLPYINELFSSDLILANILSGKMFLAMLGIALLTGLLSGLYPAFYLSMMDPLKVMKKKLIGRNQTFSLRNGLVVFQFAMVFLLIYAVSVVSQQLNHLSEKDLGFSQNQKIIIPLKTAEAQNAYQTFKNEWKNMPEVNSVAGSEFYPSQNIWYDQKVYKNGSTLEDGVVVQLNLASENFFETMGIEMLEGRAFDPTDNQQMVVNEAFLRKFGIDRTEALGMIFNRQPRNDGTQREPFEVIGVIQDYNFLSAKDEVQPVVTFYDNQLSSAIVNYSSSNTTDLLNKLESKWSSITPGVPFEFDFLDQAMASVYEEEQRLKRVSFTFTLLSILISLLGIWGLVSFTTQQRFKEIGVRKVLGASVSQITALLSKEFVMLVGLSVLLGIPLGIYLMNLWLNNYNYKIENTTGLLFFATLSTLMVCLTSVVYKTIAAAKANPVDSIKSE